MDRIDAMRVFTRVLERRSFTLAATDLGLPRSTVTDAVKKWETRLGVRLLERTTRHVSPTLDGDNFYARCVQILRDIDDAESAFQDENPKGALRVDAHGSFSRHFILPRLGAFLQRYPGINLFLSEADRRVDPLREGIDCVVRIGHLQQDDVVARQIGLLEEVTVASPAYLAKLGTPRSLNALKDHQMVGYCASGQSVAIPLEFQVNRKVTTQHLAASLWVNSAESLVEAAKRDLGIIQVPRYHVANALSQGELVALLEAYPPEPSPVWVLFPPHRQASSRVRVFIEWLQQTLEF
ncbi:MULTISPECIES: LysR family transcriptional regulator [unclassified Vibrio]|uniref:LysR family transcriptional regulator n=1 Tax=unclassified Vibrio TaxID=2614977 RepID=UPI00126971ED|nr:MULTISPECIES: LysR family transcriptional regulator [unclassified Vibrio]QFT39912.1 HTH-type transcriptional regulator DmlR [Vibrio sp. THAF64]QGM37581.1 HTH-type transcriptional regulator DmlR [Vibrio sp. THAF191d]QGN73306.1 HTH-type transcriptional regulator DmlR [Vibrio sp. THAF191c]